MVEQAGLARLAVKKKEKKDQSHGTCGGSATERQWFQNSTPERFMDQRIRLLLRICGPEDQTSTSDLWTRGSDFYFGFVDQRIRLLLGIYGSENQTSTWDSWTRGSDFYLGFMDQRIRCLHASVGPEDQTFTCDSWIRFLLVIYGPEDQTVTVIYGPEDQMFTYDLWTRGPDVYL